VSEEAFKELERRKKGIKEFVPHYKNYITEIKEARESQRSMMNFSPIDK
jgi:hypothetical protein